VNHGHELRFAPDDTWLQAWHIGAMRTTQPPSANERSVHVVPGRRGVWTVRIAEGGQAASMHPSTTQAERAAHLLARTHGATRVVVHDRYCRLRTFAVER
jgi:Ser/Thr protein kinase RdoA (MazF antagonist)